MCDLLLLSQVEEATSGTQLAELYRQQARRQRPAGPAQPSRPLSHKKAGGLEQEGDCSDADSVQSDTGPSKNQAAAGLDEDQEED
jgi:hypothetical protein